MDQSKTSPNPQEELLKQAKSSDLTLKQIQSAITKIDVQRNDASLSKQQQELLEMSALALRNAERLVIAKTQKDLFANMENSTKEINELSKNIRARVTKMNKLPKSIDAIESVLHEVVRILTAMGMWK